MWLPAIDALMPLSGLLHVKVLQHRGGTPGKSAGLGVCIVSVHYDPYSRGGGAPAPRSITFRTREAANPPVAARSIPQSTTPRATSARCAAKAKAK
jgi:hypothetical protein